MSTLLPKGKAGNHPWPVTQKWLRLASLSLSMAALPKPNRTAFLSRAQEDDRASGRPSLVVWLQLCLVIARP